MLPEIWAIIKCPLLCKAWTPWWVKIPNCCIAFESCFLIIYYHGVNDRKSSKSWIWVFVKFLFSFKGLNCFKNVAFAPLLSLTSQAREVRQQHSASLPWGFCIESVGDAKLRTRLGFSHFPSWCLSSCQECDWSVKFRSTNLGRNLNRSSNISVAVLIYSLLLAVCGFGELRDLARYSLCLLMPLLTILQLSATNIS